MSNTRVYGIDNGKKIILADNVYRFGKCVVAGGRFDPRCPIECYFCQRGLIGGGCGLTPPAGKRLCLMMNDGELLEQVQTRGCALVSDEDEHIFDTEMQLTHKVENGADEDRQIMGSELHGFGWYREEIQHKRRQVNG